MAHFAIFSPDEVGHLFPIGSLGRELVRRGHRVTVVGTAKAAPIAEQLDLPMYELSTAGIPYPAAWLTWLAFSVARAGWVVWLQGEFRWAAEIHLRRGPQALRELAVDGLLVDESRPMAGTIAEHLGLPFVTVSSALMWHAEARLPPPFTGWGLSDGRLARARNRLGYAAWEWFMRPVLKSINRCRSAWKLPRFRRIDQTHSPLAHLAQSCPQFDFPRRELPPTFHYVGSLSAQRETQRDHDFPWERLDGRPLIFASLGTVADPANLPVFPKIAEACAGVDAQLVMALGRWNDKQIATRERVGRLPGAPLLVDFAPQLALLDRSALFITHAGLNGTLEAICRGVPMVAMPRSGDQPAVAARIEHAGVGLRAPFRRGTAGEVRRVIQRVLSEERFRLRAKELQRAMMAAGGACRAADIVEEVVATRRPVQCASGNPPDFAAEVAANRT